MFKDPFILKFDLISDSNFSINKKFLSLSPTKKATLAPGFKIEK